MAAAGHAAPRALRARWRSCAAGSAWAAFDEASRLAQAKRVVDAWRAAGREIEPVRIAVPDTPGGRILFAYVAADFNAIGVPSRRVAMASKADLRLIDEVAPNDDPIWALRRLSCRPATPCKDRKSLV